MPALSCVRPLSNTDRWTGFAAKLVLIAAGFWLLYWVGNGFGAPIILLGVAVFTYGCAIGLSKISSTILRSAIGRLTVPFAFIVVVALNITGFIGTLTGASYSISSPTRIFVGATFYILSAAAFLSDVALKRIPLSHPIDYLCYLTLPFKLLAGPLETPAFIGQLENLRMRWSSARLYAAWPWLALGAFMKYVIANRLMPVAFLSASDPGSSIIVAAMFELKFYFDFAGYSFLAFGGAMLCGLRINRNFAHPFFAANVVIFWRRWHISLGQFLSRYLLEPNLYMFKGRWPRMLFTSSIFMVSAMWHGGTGNYALWGVFHGACYLSCISWLKRRHFSRPVGITAMIAFLVFARFLAIDADWHRLLVKLLFLADPRAWMSSIAAIPETIGPMLKVNAVGIVLASGFLVAESWSVRRYGVRRPYHLLRRPVPSLILLVAFLFFGVATSGLLYARL